MAKSHPGAANKALLERFPAIDAAIFSQARAIVRYAPELADQVLAPRVISFAAAVREASLRKAALAGREIGKFRSASYQREDWKTRCQT